MSKQNLHFVMNAKGGVGKSTCSIILQSFLEEKSKVLGIDTDPNNSTLSSVESLDVTFLNIMPNGDTIDVQKFDDLIIFLLENEKTKNTDIVADIGASTFGPLFNYLVENDTFNLILNEKYNIFIHIPIAISSGAEIDTLNGLEQMIDAFKGTCTFVVWSNEFFSSTGGKNIEELPLYIKHKENIFAVILMRKRDVLFSSAFEKMAKNSHTFKDIPMDTSYNILEKSRLQKIKNDYWSILDLIIPTAVSKKAEDKK